MKGQDEAASVWIVCVKERPKTGKRQRRWRRWSTQVVGTSVVTKGLQMRQFVSPRHPPIPICSRPADVAKLLLCESGCLITALQWTRMWQSSSSINTTRQSERHQFVKCKSPRCCCMSPSLFCQVPCRPKDNKWAAVSHFVSQFFTPQLFCNRQQMGVGGIQSNMRHLHISHECGRCNCVILHLGCALSHKWLWHLVRLLLTLFNKSEKKTSRSFCMSLFSLRPRLDVCG